MSHYDLTLWTDYARGMLPSAAAEQMTQHAGQCTLCAYVANLLRRAADVASADREFEPPADLVLSVERIFPGTSTLAEGGLLAAGLRKLVGKLHWDSLDGAIPVGVRSLRPDSRHVAYRAGHYSVDLWFDSDPGARSVTVTGQIADESRPDTPLRDMKAILLDGNQLIGCATTTEFGEFSLCYKPGPGVRLFMPVERSGEYVEVSLNLPEVTASC